MSASPQPRFSEDVIALLAQGDERLERSLRKMNRPPRWWDLPARGMALSVRMRTAYIAGDPSAMRWLTGLTVARTAVMFAVLAALGATLDSTWALLALLPAAYLMAHGALAHTQAASAYEQGYRACMGTTLRTIHEMNNSPEGQEGAQ